MASVGFAMHATPALHRAIGLGRGEIGAVARNGFLAAMMAAADLR